MSPRAAGLAWGLGPELTARQGTGRWWGQGAPGGGSHGRVRGLGAEQRLPAEGMLGAPPPTSVNPHEVSGGGDRLHFPGATGQPGVLAEVPGSESDGWGEWAESVLRPLPLGVSPVLASPNLPAPKPGHVATSGKPPAPCQVTRPNLSYCCPELWRASFQAFLPPPRQGVRDHGSRKTYSV